MPMRLMRCSNMPTIIPRRLGFPVAGSIAEVMDYDDLVFRHKLAKIGRTTGYSTGVVSGFGIDDVIIHVHSVGNVRFDNLLEVEWDDNPFTDEGDSGSISIRHRSALSACILPAVFCSGTAGGWV